VVRVHEDQDLVDGRRLGEDGDGVLEHRLAGDLQQLLRNRQPDPGAGTASKDHSDRPALFSHVLPLVGSPHYREPIAVDGLQPVLHQGHRAFMAMSQQGLGACGPARRHGGVQAPAAGSGRGAVC